VTGEIRQNRNISSFTTITSPPPPPPPTNSTRPLKQQCPRDNTGTVICCGQLMPQTLRARKAHLVHTRQTQLIAVHIAHQNRGLRQHQRRRILPRQTHRLCLQGTISPSTAILSALPPLGPTLTAGATGNPGKQDQGYLGKGDEKSWKQRCCTSKVQE
jgi:hypothetical protein